MNIAFFGGSFNPPHFGHFLAACWALCSGEVEQVWMAPTFSHAFGKNLLAFHHRTRMCQLVANTFSPHIFVSEVEKERKAETSYTIDTIEWLIQKYPLVRWRLLVGTDILSEKEAWKDFQRLEELSPLLVVPRASSTQVSSSLPTISSSEIRDNLSQKKDCSSLLPLPILRYIQEQGLYLKAGE